MGGENQHWKAVPQMLHHVVQGMELTGWRQAPSAAELPRQPLITLYADYRSKGAMQRSEGNLRDVGPLLSPLLKEGLLLTTASPHISRGSPVPDTHLALL